MVAPTTPPLLVESSALAIEEMVRLVVEAKVAERLVVVAFVVDALVANSEEKMLWALQVLAVVVPKAKEMVLLERVIG